MRCTARDATVLGHRVMVVGDATATRALPDPLGGVVSAPEVQRVALAALADRFAEVLTTSQVIALPTEGVSTRSRNAAAQR